MKEQAEEIKQIADKLVKAVSDQGGDIALVYMVDGEVVRTGTGMRPTLIGLLDVFTRLLRVKEMSVAKDEHKGGGNE